MIAVKLSQNCLRSSIIGGYRSISYSAILKAKATENPYTKTLLLPKTKFPLRADAAKREHLFRERCTKDLYSWQLENNPKDIFVLHDGPPYANGNVHSGHAMNKILKDIVNRYKVLQGHKVFYRPGWDCHGLPIELKALQHIRRKGSDSALTPMDIRKIAKQKALSEVKQQMESFKSWGVMGDWEKPYLTLTKDYEMRQLQVLTDMIKHGYIYRQLKPVYWSPSSRTALAESELEYKDDHISKSIHVRFPLTSVATNLQDRWKHYGSIYALIWTTTPWTIPANKAISVHPKLEYTLVKVEGHESMSGVYIVGSARVEAFKKDLGVQAVEILDEVKGSDLLGCRYEHPLNHDLMPIIAGEHVTAESGTGLVHTAPGHGMEDYEVCLRHDIQPFSPVDDFGRFTSQAGPELEGKEAFTEGTSAVIDMLDSNSSLVIQQDYTHKYPYDWRTKQPVMLRATAQWFANVEHLQNLADSVNYIIKILQEKGTDAWWEEPDDSIFVAPQYQNKGKVYKRGYDTMDVWFDSGTSWMMLKGLLDNIRDSKRPLADVYLEGSDQHRGWFQSSLLTSIAVTKKAPYGTLITHGFVLDEKGQKMSKSLGNTLEPSFITDGGKDKKKNPAYGSDVLRFWVANCEYTHDVSIGPSIIAQISDNLRKIRTTAKFLLGNLQDFNQHNYISFENLQEVDKYMLNELYKYNNRITRSYEDYAFNRAVQTIQNFTNTTLSSFYFDIIKDRLYNEKKDSASRRAAQTVLYEILQSYTKSLAPFICHTAEEIYENYKQITSKPESSVYKTGWLISRSQWNNEELMNKWATLLKLKAEVNKALEFARQEKQIRSSQEADITLGVGKDSPLHKAVMSLTASELSSILMVSQVNVVEDVQKAALNSMTFRKSSIEGLY
ncbi:tRNA synthetases class I-domain-containing protein [Mycotypha africana]|uniref:tRNA synthetases class I-domain-containing protein n=1 Tax=Mycotypha africana TaxID=64632 RepID=UPI002300E31D|nr:tRNA synthetases class I-domain-containing protein [Mycotypha africana]KAI8971969.1 tRNA synthetases class I-domain-containing protein [Mycotypha africana]